MSYGYLPNLWKICKVLFSYYKLQIGQNQGYGVNGDILTKFSITIKTTYIRNSRILLFNNLKACVRYFLSNFSFSPTDDPLKTMKNVFYFF